MTPQMWSISALELTVLWHAIGRDVLPYPLRYRPTEDTAEAYERAYKASASGVRAIFDEDMYGPLRVLVEPEARIEVAGFAGTPRGVLPREDADPAALVRIHAAVSGRSAVILTQEPTPDPNRGGTVRMVLVGAHTVARRVLAALPEAPRGTGAGFEINRADLDGDDDRPFTGFSDDAPRSRRTEVERFFERRRTTVAHIAVYAGGAFDNRPTRKRDFHIMDYPEGRYRVGATAAIHAAPAATAELGPHLQSLLDRTLREYREDNDPTYEYT
ncbi:ESX secretion-associated protein EspG [Nocardia sp. NBC_00565]|uniref:ESX secretion-associated protein EspG n=1 Tax=Nocardia sp. NBC_00565 TaxID=2975993 RepID=UPI002E817B33|nr:ESX secretion-associated protein EspG [Nocardia sp. NBC_00565]WUC04303.1 ESX secretion-associated protein EspG [Nocardia sp. NBC_00565]